MKEFFKSFSDSAAEFKNLRSLVTAALLIALHTVFACFFSIMVTDSLRISISFIVNVVIGCMFGPVMGLVCGGIGDIIQYVIKPTGPYFIGWTISAALAGLLYGAFFYRKYPKNLLLTKDQVNGNAKENKAVLNEKRFSIGMAIIAVIAMVIWAAAPFLMVSDAKTGAIVTNGSGYAMISNLFAGSGSHNAAIVSGIAVVLCIVVLVMSIFNMHIIPLIISVLTTFASVLAVYTDKKTTTAEWGFWILFVLVVIYMIGQIIFLAKKHRVDLPFMFRCVCVLTIDGLVLNALLGTYWVSFMYGKGFAFYFVSRFIKSLIQLPINIIITYYVIGFVREMRSHIK